jgi:2-C-methyl-D-erythritol 4-phosphate cytidylyltransferase
MKNAAILLAAGGGSRMRGSVKDKVIVPLLGKPVLAHSAEAFIESGCVSELVLVCRDDAQIAEIKSEIGATLAKIPHTFTYGGKERQDSVLNGIEASSPACEIIFIHDCARPLVGSENIKKLLAAARADSCAVLASKVVDTIKRLDGNPQELTKRVLNDLERPLLWAMQTPQVFKREIILESYRKIKRENIAITDDVAAATACGHKVSIVENLSPNPKITVPEDLALVEFLKQKGMI